MHYCVKRNIVSRDRVSLFFTALWYRRLYIPHLWLSSLFRQLYLCNMESLRIRYHTHLTLHQCLRHVALNEYLNAIGLVGAFGDQHRCLSILYIFYVAHLRTTQKHTNRHNHCYHDNYILAQATRMNQKLLLGKSQISYQCKYIHIYKKQKII